MVLQSGFPAFRAPRLMQRLTTALPTFIVFSAVLSALSLKAMTASAQPPSRPPAPLTYTVRPVINKGTVDAVSVELRFKGSATGTTVLDLPKEWGGKTKLYEALSDFSVVGGNSRIQPGNEPSERVVHHRAGAALRIQYIVHHADEGGARQGNPYRPIISASRLQLLGSTIFVAPHRTDDGDPVMVVLKGFPTNWTVASDLERSGLTFKDLQSSIIVAGDFRVLTRIVSGAPLRLAIDGSWSFSDQEFADTLAKIRTVETQFWGDPAEPYLVTLLQLEAPAGSTSSGGTGRSAAFASFATPNVSTPRLVRMFAHEMLHTWIPNRIGVMPDQESSGVSEATEYWISEGFDDYYTLRILGRGDLWSPTEIVGAINSVLHQYAASPMRTASNARIASEFWSNYDVQQLPYYRGMLFATIVDYRLRKGSGGATSLDDVMRLMHKRFTAMPKPIRELFVSALAEFGVDIQGDLRTYIDDGAPIILPADTFVPCGTISTEVQPRFDTGFNLAATGQNGGTVVGVNPELAAYRAGLRDGMRIVARESGEVGNPLREMALRVDDQGSERVIRYLPQARDSIEVQSLAPSESAGPALAACARRLGGA